MKIGIVGATGYTGVELLRLLAVHPEANVVAVTSRQDAGKPVSAMFPCLRQHYDLKFSTPDQANLEQCDVVFFATPNGIAMKEAPRLLDLGVKVIDLSADYRIKDVTEWETWYGMVHASPEWIKNAVYGLPEFNRTEIRRAQLIANPGCYPTAVQLGLKPLLLEDVVEADTLIADCKSGVSGAGRKAEIGALFSEVADNFKAYGVEGHRHLPEIRQGLQSVTQQMVGLTFVPHLTPMIRGIHATLYATLKRPMQLDELRMLYHNCYQHEYFVDVLEAGCVETRSVRGSNRCRLAVHCPQGGRTVVILAVIDNLVKGAAGQAIQNMNIMFGLPEETGLNQVPLSP